MTVLILLYRTQEKFFFNPIYLCINLIFMLINYDPDSSVLLYFFIN